MGSHLCFLILGDESERGIYRVKSISAIIVGYLLASPSFVLADTAVLVAMASIRPDGKESSEAQPYNFNQEDVVRFLRTRGTNVEHVADIRRNAAGTKLFVMLFWPGRDRVVTITSNRISIVTSPGIRGFPDNDGDFAAWLGNETTKTVHFKSGESLTLGRFDLFDVDPSGQYFIVGEKPNSTWLGRVASPSDKVKVSNTILGTRVFVSGKEIFVCGNFYRRKGRGYDSEAACLIVQDEGNSFQLGDEHTFDWASGIVDVDPFSHRLLLWNKWDEFSSVYMYDLDTKRRQRLGFAKGFQFFLAVDLLHLSGQQ